MRRFSVFLALSLLLAACTHEDLRRFFAPAPALEIRLAPDMGNPAYSIDTPLMAAEVIRRRLDIAGIKAEVSTELHGEIVVIPANDADVEAVIVLATRRGVLEFADLRNAPPELLIRDGAAITTSARPGRGDFSDPLTGAPYETVLYTVEVAQASANLSQFGTTWDILVRFSPEHGAILAEYTAANTGTMMGIVVDGVLISAPVIQAQIGEEALIAGNFTEGDSRELAAILGGGTLPVEYRVVSQDLR